MEAVIVYQIDDGNVAESGIYVMGNKDKRAVAVDVRWGSGTAHLPVRWLRFLFGPHLKAERLCVI